MFGNPVVEKDSLPLRLLPKLRKRFPTIQFIEADPTELLDYKGDVWILDAAEGIQEVTILDDLSKLDLPVRFSVHDYDLAMDLAILRKTGKLGKVNIIAVPTGMQQQRAFRGVTQILTSIES